MSKFSNIFHPLILLMTTLFILPACSTTASMAEKKMEIYEVHHDGRINVFYERELYKEFLQVGETPYRLTRIGAGPNGETVVFGLTKDDKKMKHDIPAISIFDGTQEAPSQFYAEMRKHGRIYVFDRYSDMTTVRQFGHPNYFYTQIGSGPKGETVVYVLNKSNKKHRPDALLDKFKKINHI